MAGEVPDIDKAGTIEDDNYHCILHGRMSDDLLKATAALPPEQEDIHG